MFKIEIIRTDGVITFGTFESYRIVQGILYGYKEMRVGGDTWSTAYKLGEGDSVTVLPVNKGA